MAGALIAIIVLGSAVTGWHLLQQQRERQRRNEFAQREASTFSEWCEANISQGRKFDQRVAWKVLLAFGEAFDIGPTTIRWEDRFDEEFSLGKWYFLDDCWGVVDLLLSESFQRTDSDRGEKWKTIGDVIVSLSRHAD